MARIRSIKPDYYNDEKLAKISIQANFLYSATWVFADDAGVIRQSPNWIKSQVFPHREEISLNSVKKWIKELEKGVWLFPFEYNGEKYYCITNFRAHQKIDRPQPSKIPTEVIEKIRQDSTNARRMLDERSSPDKDKDKDKDKERMGEEAKIPPQEIPPSTKDEKEEEPPIAAAPPLKVIGENVDPENQIALRDLSVCHKIYWGDLYGEARRVLAYNNGGMSEAKLLEWAEAFNRRLVSEGCRGKSLSDYTSHFSRWLNKEDKKRDPKNLYNVTGNTKNGQQGGDVNSAYKEYLAAKMAGNTG